MNRKAVVIVIFSIVAKWYVKVASFSTPCEGSCNHGLVEIKK